VTTTDLVRKLRRTLKDAPDRTFVVNDPLSAGATTLTIPSSDVTKFPTSGVTLEFDDGTDEEVLTTAGADASSNSVPIMRGMGGTADVDHLKDTPVLIESRWGFAELVDALNLIVDTELWPHVWIKGETPVTPDFTKEYIPSAITGVEEPLYAYQLNSGFRYPLHIEWLSPAFADDANFPNGAFLIDRSQYINTSPVYVSYRQQATIDTLAGSLERITLLGASGHLLLMEEAKHVAPAASQADRGVAEGAKDRAGLVLWQRFEQARIRVNVTLSHEEQQRRHVLVRG